MKERLDKIIANGCLISRTDAAKQIKAGHVTVDGQICRISDQKEDLQESDICLDGQSVPKSKFIYLMMNKPAGYLSATEDKRDATVMELLPERYKNRKPSVVGRLDKDTEGLLLLTDDGELNHRLTSPKRHVEKLYYAEIDGELTDGDIESFARGMDLGDFSSMPASVKAIDSTLKSCLVTIKEGKFHQVKRMFEKCGKNVKYLKRLKIGTLELDKALDKGGFRQLSQLEIEELLRATKMFC